MYLFIYVCFAVLVFHINACAAPCPWIFLPPFSTLPPPYLFDHCDWLFEMTRSNQSMRCRLDWLKSTSFHYYVTPVRQRTGSRWQRPWGAFSAPERYGLNRCFWSTVWSFWECNVRASFLFSCRIPCQLCSGGNFIGAFRPQYRSVLATSRLAVSTANDVGTYSFNCTENNNRLKTGWRLVLVSSCLF